MRLADVLDYDAITRLAGQRSLGRGEEYASSGAVGRVSTTDARIEGTVHGTSPYRVRLEARDRGLGFDCTCPVGRDGAFCKHCVALALCWLEDGEATGPAPDAVRAFLTALDPEQLVDLLVDHADQDERLATRLRLQALQAQQGGVDVAAYRSMLDRAITIHGYVDYAEAWGYVEGIMEVVASLEGLLADGHAQDVVALAEHGLTALEAAIERVDDSDGGTGEIVARLEDLHLAACEHACPDPAELAERLFALELASQYDIFSAALDRYAEVLGEAGVERYRELAEVEWERVRATPQGARAGHCGSTWRITQIMETLADRDGDVDALVAIKARDLESGWRYLQIAETLERAGRGDEALVWAERGLAAFPERVDSRLREFVIVAYRHRGRSDEALELRAAQFREAPTFASYRALRDDAGPLGHWQQRRDEALSHLLALVAGTEHATAGGWVRDRSALVEIFLWENDVKAAWEHAQAGGCARDIWRRLAEARAAERPDDALAVYRMLIGRTVGATNDNAYRDAVALLEELERLLADHGRDDDHARLLADLRAAHRRKRNLMKRLDRRWPAPADAR